ncbi:pilus assembly protein PilF [Polaromonas sp. YR568]|uniref:pilus assembly protein PilF n=1 Tax=Polaromonas sp. YR568 TaxID=1855301 RepID=UPI00398C1AEE
MRISHLFTLAGFFASAVLLAVYWPGLHGGFFFDDGPSILLAQGVRLENLSLESIHQALVSGGAGPSGRPVAQLSFALNYYFSGFDPFAFKATNLAIHFACGVIVFALALRLLMATAPAAKRQDALIASSAVAALWLLQPIQLLPVLHVVQRMTSLSAFFLLAALLLHVFGRERGDRTGVAWILMAWGILWPLSFFSKETGVLFPLFALAWEVILHRASIGKLDRFARGLVALVSLVLIAGAVYVLLGGARWLWAGYDLRAFSLMERVLSEARILWFYLGLMIAPRIAAFGLYHDDIAISTGLLSPWTTLPALLGLAGLVWLAWRLRKSAPLAAFGIAWFLIGHALESTVLPLELAHEHRNYLPLLGVLLAAGWALARALEDGRYRPVGIALAGTVLVYTCFVTGLRANQFGEDLRRTQIEAQHHPASAQARHEAGIALANLPQAAAPDSRIYALARNHYEAAGEVDPDFKMSLLGLIQLDCKAKKTLDRAAFDELSRRLHQARFAPGDRSVLYSLKLMAIEGTACMSRPEVDGLFTSAIANPGVSPYVQAILHSWHADYLWLHERDLAAARRALEQSLALSPGNPSNRLKWAQLVLISGEREQAMRLLRDLQGENLSADERQTLNELLAAK